MNPPVARKIPYQLITHNHERTDNYYWLNNRLDQEVIAYLQAENQYTEEALQPSSALREALFVEMKARVKQSDQTFPTVLNGYSYYVRYEQGKEYPVICRKATTDQAAEEIMLDANALADGLAFFHLIQWEVSPDNTLLAFSIDTVGRRQYTLKIKNLTTGELLPDEITNTSGAMAWSGDGQYLFYTRKDDTLRPALIFRHHLGEASAHDVLVYEEMDTAFRTFVYKSKSDKYLIIGSESTLSSEYRILEAMNPTGRFRLFQPRIPSLKYSIYHQNDRFLVRTNDNAQNFRLMETSEQATNRESWHEFLAHRHDVLLEGVEVFAQFTVVNERKEGLIRFRIIKVENNEAHYLSFDEEDYYAFIAANPDYNSTVLRYHYTSLKTPETVFDYDLQHRERTFCKQQEVPGGFNPDQYVTKRCMVPARDGKKVPVSLVHKKGLLPDGKHPLLLYGYGSYGINIDSTFRSSRLSLLDRGFVFAIAHVRGGQELGRSWYEEGKLLAKKNTFFDYIDCGNYLIEKGYAARDKLFGYGGSAGGLLIGAVINMQPDLFRGVIAAVPFVDIVTTMLDDSIPLTTGEYDEWGNPNDEVFYKYMLSYSPYDQVKEQNYPAILVTTGLHDSQVQYWEPTKWVAKLRDYKTNDQMLLLKTNMETGHGGASGRFEALRDVALEYAFLMQLLDSK
ncbi:MAG: S9 family peptidase [Bacteroidales bacterium]|nr:S9 family peptidase [Bacteroidales bacterium]